MKFKLLKTRLKRVSSCEQCCAVELLRVNNAVLFFPGEEVLLIQEKLDGIKTRYADITVTSSKALRTLEQARQLATKFHSTYEELTGWLREVEEELAASGGQSPTGEQIPQFQQRQKVSHNFTL